MKKSTVLIVSDCDILDQNIKSKLRSKRWDLVESYGVDDIIKTLNNHKVDIVISCLNHTLADKALKVTKEIRCHSPHIPMIGLIRSGWHPANP